jgi:putative intracellular protease/amidase
MNVEILVFEGVEALDVFGPLSALAGAGFEVALVVEGGPRQVRTADGTGLSAREPGATPGVLVVPGGAGSAGASAAPGPKPVAACCLRLSPDGSPPGP